MRKSVLGAVALVFALVFVQSAMAQSWDSEPAPPPGSSPNQAIPVRDTAGRFATPNVGLSREATIWHMRAALNVAALGCRDAAEQETVAQYNKLLSTQRRGLAAADLAVKAQYRARFGARWSKTHDQTMTRVYNFFAQPPAQPAFCEAARGVLLEAQTIPPGKLADFAAGALPRLEAPFTDFYVRYEAYRLAMTAWRERGLTLATSETLLPSPVSINGPLPAPGFSSN